MPWVDAPWLDPLEELTLVGQDDTVLSTGSDIVGTEDAVVVAVAWLETVERRYEGQGADARESNARRLAAMGVLEQLREHEPDLSESLRRRQRKLAKRRRRRAERRSQV